MKRRQFVTGIATTGAISALAGCVGGNGGSGNSSGNSSGSGATTTSESQVNAFGERPDFDRQKLYIPIRSEANIDKVELRDANKQMWGTYNVEEGEGTAEFTVIKEGGDGYKKYPYGRYEVYAVKNGTRVDAVDFEMQPRFEVTEVISAEGGELRVKLENTGNAPAVVTGARLYKQGTNPGESDGWSVGVYEGYEREIVQPGATTTVPVLPFGFGQVYAEGTDEVTPQSTSEGVCAGETRTAVVDYRLFGNIHSGPQLTLQLGGGRSQLDRPGIGCKSVSIQSKSGGASSPSNATNSTTSS
ncbi:hypothetical protein [Halococcus sp. PRR34]|uniref:hypothetical protein n=1 Tax=Halococcus sp. PRR34 TaxID=3020830 RepID=UPI0023621EFC|nr:hypothetical protein [Halococcus sp. PRR34]